MSERVLYYAVQGSAQRWEVPIRDLKPNEVRVKIHSIGINPIDWKTIDNNLADGAGQGNDFAGVVTEVGSAIKNTKVGDTVAGGVGGGDIDNKENGAFTNLLNVDEKLLFKFPNQLVSAKSDQIDGAQQVTTFEQAASLGIACDTAAIAFEGVQPKSGEWALIYGASSSLGYIAVQFAKNLGFNVIGVSAPNSTLYKDLDIHFLDRNDPEWIVKARQLSNDNITFGYDTIGKDGSPDRIVEAVSNTKPATAAFNDPGSRPSEVVVNAHQNVKLLYPLYFMLMQETKKLGALAIPKDEHLYNNCGQIIERINKFFNEKKFRTLSIKVLHGLDKINEGLALNRSGVSGTKIVINVD